MVPRITRFNKSLNIDYDDWSFSRMCGDMIEDGQRNALIVADAVQSLKDKRTPLVLSQRKAHVRALPGLLREATGAKVLELVGSGTAKDKRVEEAELSGFKNDEPVIIVATGQYVGEGFDMPRLDTLHPAMPISWKGLAAQYAGRLHREYAGKRDVLIYDYVDIHVETLERMCHRRLKAYA